MIESCFGLTQDRSFRLNKELAHFFGYFSLCQSTRNKTLCCILFLDMPLSWFFIISYQYQLNFAAFQNGNKRNLFTFKMSKMLSHFLSDDV